MKTEGAKLIEEVKTAFFKNAGIAFGTLWSQQKILLEIAKYSSE